MQTDLGFKVCRLCLSPGTTASLTSLFEESGENVEKLRSVSGVDISTDGQKHDAVCCRECLLKIGQAIEVRERARENEKYYFEAKRDRIARNEEEAYDGITNFGFRVCRMCLTPDTVVDVKSLFESADKFQMVFGIDISKDINRYEALVCNTCSADFERSSELRKQFEKQERSLRPRKRKEEAVAKVQKKSQENSKKKWKMKLKTVEDVESFKSLPEAKNAETDTRKSIKKPNSSAEGSVQKKSFKCSICERFCDCRNDLRKHINMVHAKMKHYSCDFCQKQYYFKSAVINHITQIHVMPHIKPKPFYDKNRPFKCTSNGCPKYFKTNASLETHQKLSHSEVRDFVCWCEKSFKSKFDWTAHQMVHSDVRPFVCWCKKAFKFKGQLKTHQEKKHAKEVESSRQKKR